MSDKNLARRAEVKISFSGVDITDDIRPYFLSMSYTDKQEDESDDLQIEFTDAAGIWLEEWLNMAIEAAAGRGMSIDATIIRHNWEGDGKDESLDAGSFELDNVDYSGPPAKFRIKATALPFTAQVRQTKKTKGWEEYNLSGIANEIAGKNGMTCMFLSANNPYYARIEQYKTSDIQFLKQLCHDAGCSLKATDQMLVIFDQKDYESREAIRTIERGDHTYEKYKLQIATADSKYQSCRVSYNDPESGECIEGTAFVEDYDSSKETNQQLELTYNVESESEAKELAEKNLRLHNKYARKAQFTVPGDITLLAGMNVELKKWGGWDGKYIIEQAVHSVSSSGGYTTQINMRRVLEGI